MNAVALQSKNKKICYKKLKSSVESVGSYLSNIGIQAGDRVVLVVSNSIEYVIAFYAVWKLGAIVVALNPQSKFDEIKNVIGQCDAKILIIENVKSVSIESLKKLNIKILSLASNKDDGFESWSNAISCSDSAANAILDESSLAQIIFTSGTTGNPKGVLLTHGNLMANTVDIVEYLQLSDSDSALDVLPFHYSYGNSVLHSHIFSAAKIVLSGSMAFPQDVVNSLREFNISGFYGVPSTYRLLLSRSDWAQKKLPLRYLTQAGGPMGIELTNQLLNSINSDTKLFIMYGQTEATARISWLPPAALLKKMGSVGIAVKHIKIEIRDSLGCKLANNKEGAVYVSGDSIMQGYWNNEEATQQVIINGWLKTGDIGYLDDDDFLYLVGRKNDMIKVGAHRINPLELEEVINKLLFIDDSAVIGVDDDILGQALCAYVVCLESKQNMLELKRHCSEYLPLHKIPRVYKCVNELPKTSSGKIQRYKLLQT